MTDNVLMDALYAALNMEGPATAATQHLGAYKDLDAKWHFDKIREAIASVPDNNVTAPG